MANQERSMNEANMAGGMTSRGHLGLWVLGATVVVVIIAIAAILSVSGNNSTAAVRQAGPVAQPAMLDREDTVRATSGYGAPAADQSRTTMGGAQTQAYEAELARQAASEAARARYEREHGQ